MRFEHAIIWARYGSYITRKEWENEARVYFTRCSEGCILVREDAHKSAQPYVPVMKDYFSKDWKIVDFKESLVVTMD